MKHRTRQLLHWPGNQPTGLTNPNKSCISRCDRHPPAAQPQQEVSLPTRRPRPNDIQGKAGRGRNHMTAELSLPAAASQSQTLLSYWLTVYLTWAKQGRQELRRDKATATRTEARAELCKKKKKKRKDNKKDRSFQESSDCGRWGC